MKPHDGISEKFKGLAAALGEHFIALASLAGLEAGELLKRSALTFLIGVGILFFSMIAYISLIAMIITLAITCFGMNLLMCFFSVAIFHFILVGSLLLILRYRRSTPLFVALKEEIRRDIEALKKPSTLPYER